MNYKTIVAAMGVAMLAGSAQSGDYRWNVKSTMAGDGRSTTFYADSSWVGEAAPPIDGTASLNFILTNAVDASGNPITNDKNSQYYRRQAIILGTNSMANTTVKFAAITGSMPLQSLVAYGQKLTLDVADPSGFIGPWRIESQGKSGFAFENDGSSNPTVNVLENGYLTYLDTKTAATKATVGSLVSGGVFMKAGAGTLKITNPGDLQATCGLAEGTLALGRAASETTVPSALVTGAVFHVDAQATDSLTTTTDDDGNVRVTAWRDLASENRTMASYADDTPYAAPRLITAGGVPLVDFGAHERQWTQNRDGADKREVLSSEAQLAELGHAATLSTPNSSRVKNVREVFAVAEVTSDSTSTAVYFCGGNWHYGWSLSTNVKSPMFSEGVMSDPTISGGTWLFDGTAKTPVSYPEKRRLVVYSVKGRATSEFTHLAGQWRDAETGSAIFGGIRLGEVVAYDRELTDAERLANHRYLMNKWHVGSERTSWDLGTVALRGESTAIDVGEGDVARVRHVRGTSTPFDWVNARFPLNKTGAGELVLEDVYPTNLPIHVKGGSVSFTSTIGRDAITGDAPASGAYCHLDATKADTLVAGSTGIATWKDCDGRTTSMRVIDGRAEPTAVASDAVGGRTVVDFGESYVALGAAMRLYDGESASSERMYDVFAVVRRNDPDAESKIFASTGWEIIGSKTGFANTGICSALAAGANYSANGRFTFVDGLGNATSTTNFNVYGLSVSQTPLLVNALAYWCSSGANGGGIQVAEWICYARRLTDAERLGTTAYLMKKWGRGDHPDRAVGAIGAIDFASGVAPTIGTDSPRTVASIASADANATLVKTGAGRLTVGTLANVSSVRVTDGALTVTGAQDLRLDSLALDAAAFAEDAAPRVSVNGALSFAEGGALVATVPDDIPYGEWQIAQATAVEDDNLASWTLNVRSQSGARLLGAFGLRVRGDGVWLCHARRGALVIIR